MSVLNLRTAAVALLAGVGLAGCAYGPYGGLDVGAGYGNGYYGAGYSPYGYGSPYGGYGGYGSPYGYGYGSPYGYGGYGYVPSYYGWYDGFYYPGTGYYVYDQNRQPHRWSQEMQQYWGRRAADYFRTHKGATTTAAVTTENWGDFNNRNRQGTAVRVRGGNDERVRFQHQRAERAQRVQSAADDNQPTVQHQNRRGGRWKSKDD